MERCTTVPEVSSDIEQTLPQALRPAEKRAQTERTGRCKNEA